MCGIRRQGELYNYQIQINCAEKKIFMCFLGDDDRSQNKCNNENVKIDAITEGCVFKVNIHSTKVIYWDNLFWMEYVFYCFRTNTIQYISQISQHNLSNFAQKYRGLDCKLPAFC